MGLDNPPFMELPNAIEAYTSPNVNSTFGLYCSEGQCIFYLYDPMRCQPGSVSPVLMSGVDSAASVSVRCSQVGNNLFQILEPFNAIFETIKRGMVVSFAKPLSDGTLAVHTYSLQGSNLAVNRALSEAARNVKQSPAQPKVKPPSIEPIPGAKKLQDIKT